ncbi:MAG: bifunctional UDP-N-acetylglucosamine diphosphorylase/glucosamine-1-phosphate N-acetyltransferase GlmU, partial [Gammaproteobacteria bacterium]|nr:bifunctional UDP-N-acetylglucosamine diphosphorylase/glucosamine-1-phosphate N-acetyltransferase GlmU [Gammaproteobacteria bacterium]
MKLSAIILAAGQGKRMNSTLPKVMHKLAGMPMLEHVYLRSLELAANDIHIVYGHGGEHLHEYCSEFDVEWILQEEQLGTAHAVQQASPHINDEHVVLILYGDVPLIKSHTLKKLVNSVTAETIALLTVNLHDPTGYGRIIRKNGQVVAIVEHKDASDEQKLIKEVNTGIMALPAGYLNRCLHRIDNKNVQREYYLTDVIALAVNDGKNVKTSQPDYVYEVEGVNDRNQLSKLERIKQRERVDAIMAQGVTVADPSRVDIRGEITVGNDSFIDINCIFEGKVTIGSNVSIGPGCVINDSQIADDVVIKPYSIIEQTMIDKRVEVGPFARIRPGTHLKEGCKVGNFVEVKNTQLGFGSKANHLTYLGDAVIGSDVNIGAGTITCNYDGAYKHKTVIMDGAFIGSDTQLVAPVKVGKNSTIGAGSTITRDTDDDALTLSRVEQKTIDGWKRP